MRLELLSRGGLHIPSPQETLKMGMSVLEQAAAVPREFFSQTSDLLFPHKTPEQFVRDLERYKPLHDAEVGFSAVEYGEKKNDWELVYFGGAMAVKAMVSAYERPKVPSYVTQAIVGGVIEHHIVPAEQPLLTDDLVERSEPPIKKYGNTVLELFPRLENKL